MPVPLARKGVLAAGVVVVLAILLVVGLPLVASTQIVRDGIAYQMSAWSGYRVRLGDTPDIRVWPFRAVLHDVTLSDWSEANPQPVLEAEQVQVDLSALAALRGEIVFTKMRLIQPVLRLRGREGALRLTPPQSWGRLSRSVTAAREVVAAAPTEPDTSALPSDTFGEVEVVDGRITTRIGGRSRDIVTSLAGVFNWPALNRQASLSAKGIWRGENVTLEAASTQPLVLLGGGSAPVNFSLQATPATASFTGTANFSGKNFVDGQLDFSAPSLNRLVEWTHSVALPGTRVGPVTVAAKVTGDMSRLKFEGATLGLDKSTGKGLLDVSLGPGRPSVVGTLAFDTLNLRALLDTFSPFSPAALPAQTAPPSMNPSGYDFDLRFSAASAGFEAATLTDVAAAVKVKDGLSTFDISDATAFGGTIQLGVRADQTGGSDVVEIRMRGEEIDMGQLAETFEVKQLVPQARCTLSVVLKGTGNDLDAVLETADGSVSATFGAGNVPGLSLETFLQRSAEGDFFPLRAMGEGALPISRADVKATLSKGVARIDQAEAFSGQHRIGLDGLVPFASRGLALYGTLTSLDGADPRFESPLTFFVGGSWSTPFIASFLSPARGEGR
ncbi:AsmA family protein [Chelativorans xinjiangense]|uniref:AsmA family protein n=1 Tax=Chelativorans xinjiangense TaxID=2681485 RepID=UPI001357B13C|nr:AsmA-like C-terminal region-containing protein [Chelativorans xinjiangense]